ncbi:IS66 family transposase [Massilia scottii]|uniref:IS66 family transposase n=1 Tax=Massilia scottii TaxID=3057166 RepID=UPI00279649DB|nr:transposase [Massilia sp. CCM 9029]MDQ1834573.1 transposase [Massilia sp. CCM 9029]
MRQVSEPQLPLTNNAAEQALRHWVIARRISMGNRSEAGTRAFAFLASVIETCRKHSASWTYIAGVIAAARRGLAVPALTAIPVGV